MTKYVQTNEAGYIVSLTNEPLLIGLFGGSLKNYREISDEEARAMEPLLKSRYSSGKGLHIDEIVRKED
jgi:hypothetical protein